MKTTVQIGRLKYLVRAPTDQRPFLAKLHKAHPNMPWDEVKRHLTPEAMLAARVKELTEYALKCTGRHRKVRLYTDPRIFPSAGLTVKVYVQTFYSLNNLGTPSHFAPLADRVTCPQGMDSQEK